MGLARKSGLVSAAWGLIGAGILAIGVWGMPVKLAVASIAFGAVYGLWPIMWIVVAALWLYNLSIATGQFVLLQRWMMEHASGDRRIQVILVAFAFGALLEGTAGFGAPVAVAAYLLLGLGFTAFFAPEAHQGHFIVPHNDSSVRTTDERAAILVGFCPHVRLHIFLQPEKIALADRLSRSPRPYGMKYTVRY